MTGRPQSSTPTAGDGYGHAGGHGDGQDAARLAGPGRHPPPVGDRSLTIARHDPGRDRRGVAGGGAAARLLAAGPPRLQPPRLRLAGPPRLPRALRHATRRGRAARHEPGAVGHGPDRRAVRRGRGGAGLARHLRAGRPAGARAPGAAGDSASPARAARSAAAGSGAGRATASGPPSVSSPRFFVANYCPLLFLEEQRPQPHPGPAARQRAAAARGGLRRRAAPRSVELLAPQMVVGVGAFAARSAARALAGTGVRVEQVLHPSPASPSGQPRLVRAARRAG